MAETAFDVRPARLEDTAQMARVYVESWRAAYAGVVPSSYLVGMREEVQRERWRDFIRCGEDVLVATSEGQVVGLTSFGPARELPCDGEIFTLYVAVDWQNQGAGARLLRAAFRSMRARGRRSAGLWVLAENPARFFYQTLGGLLIGEREEPFAGKRLKEIAYAWRDLDVMLRSKEGGG